MVWMANGENIAVAQFGERTQLIGDFPNTYVHSVYFSMDLNVAK